MLSVYWRINMSASKQAVANTFEKELNKLSPKELQKKFQEENEILEDERAIMLAMRTFGSSSERTQAFSKFWAQLEKVRTIQQELEKCSTPHLKGEPASAASATTSSSASISAATASSRVSVATGNASAASACTLSATTASAYAPSTSHGSAAAPPAPIKRILQPEKHLTTMFSNNTSISLDLEKETLNLKALLAKLAKGQDYYVKLQKSADLLFAIQNRQNLSAAEKLDFDLKREGVSYVFKFLDFLQAGMKSLNIAPFNTLVANPPSGSAGAPAINSPLGTPTASRFLAALLSPAANIPNNNGAKKSTVATAKK